MDVRFDSCSRGLPAQHVLSLFDVVALLDRIPRARFSTVNSARPVSPDLREAGRDQCRVQSLFDDRQQACHDDPRYPRWTIAR